jgi:phosphocarrier protein
MAVMMLGAGKGTVMTIRTEGEDEAAAADAVVALINDRFGEDE